MVIAPGLLYGSLAPALLVRGRRRKSCCNLVAEADADDGFTVADFARRMKLSAIFRGEWIMLYNNHPLPERVIKKYTPTTKRCLIEWDKSTEEKRIIMRRVAFGCPIDIIGSANQQRPLAAQRNDSSRYRRGGARIVRIYFA